MVILTHIDKVPRVKRGLAQPNIQSEKLWARIDKNLAEITEKLNRLTGPQ
jgi:hypothetical protein